MKKRIVIPILAGIGGTLLAISLVFLLISFIFSGTLFLGKFLGPTESSAEEVKVKSFIGMHLDDVIHNEEYLEKYTFDEVVEMYDESPAGTIIKQNPGDGRVEKVKCAVKLWVSKGEQPIAVPPVVGLDSPSAVARIQNLGLKYQAYKQYDDIVPEGCVISTDPPVGTKVTLGTTVTIYISNGSNPNAVTF